MTLSHTYRWQDNLQFPMYQSILNALTCILWSFSCQIYNSEEGDEIEQNFFKIFIYANEQIHHFYNIKEKQITLEFWILKHEAYVVLS